MPKTNTDQIRRLQNNFALAGPIAEVLDYKTGTSKDTGVPWISFSGVIRCGDNATYDQRFKIFSSAKKKDMNTGEYVDRPNYKKLKDWCDACVPMTENAESPTWVELGGFIGMNDYVNRDNKLVESVQFNVLWTRPYEDYKAEINLEAMIQAIKDETDKNDEPTGRSKVRMIGMDIYGNAVDMKITKADEDISKDLQDADYGTGSLATYYISLIPSTPVEIKQEGGIGKQRTTMGRSFLEYMIVGASAIIEETDEKNYIDPKVFKSLMGERKNKLEEIQEAGYQGGQSNTTTTSSNSASASKAKGVGKANSSAKAKSNTEEDDDDPDMPF